MHAKIIVSLFSLACKNFHQEGLPVGKVRRVKTIPIFKENDKLTFDFIITKHVSTKTCFRAFKVFSWNKIVALPLVGSQ